MMSRKTLLIPGTDLPNNYTNKFFSSRLRYLNFEVPERNAALSTSSAVLCSKFEWQGFWGKPTDVRFEF